MTYEDPQAGPLDPALVKRIARILSEMDLAEWQALELEERQEFHGKARRVLRGIERFYSEQAA